jgi:hypothetical protein
MAIFGLRDRWPEDAMSDVPVPVVVPPEPPKPQTFICANCGADLAGEYCAACGQRHEPHVHTLGHFVGEAFESITHADSRLWRTLWRLLARPGTLTREFFAGHRVRYLPPFRLYLVLSVIFFLLTAIAGGGPDTEPDPARAVEATPVQGLVIKVDAFDDFCRPFDKPDQRGDSNAARDNIRKFCNRVRNDGRALGEAVVHNIPRAMFVFLPLLAGIMKLLYWRPKRYYVEHLLLMIHNHAAVFLVFSLVALLSMIPWVRELATWYFLVALGYMTWYIFRAMRNVYGQGWWLTFAKYFFMFWTYIITALVSLLLTLVFTAVTG